jgi:hypothetical protein
MKRDRVLFLVLLFGLLITSRTLAQDSSSNPSEAAADLRARLAEVQANEAYGKARLEQLNEALKPENIERSLAGVGSTRPEELREQRRRELTLERDSVKRQLELLETSRLRLESAIQIADNRAYQESANGIGYNQLEAIWLSSVQPRKLLIASITFVSLVVLASLIIFLRRR